MNHSYSVCFYHSICWTTGPIYLFARITYILKLKEQWEQVICLCWSVP